MYQSLYRKYRPQTFSEIYGQDAISITLTNAIIYDRVAHAYLFSGPRGTGKTSTAKLLAKALNCTNIIDGRICDECENCQLIKNNAHPDVIEIDAASNNGVDEVRDLIEKVKYAPIKGKKKIYIIDEIHMMSQGAFNALLKTLEEPPEHVVFILATTEHHKVPETIKSRCQRFNFKKLSNEDIVARLENILDNEQASYERNALMSIAAQSDGGMRDAISMLEQVLIYANNNISMESVNEALDLVAKDKIKDIFDLILEKELNQVLTYIENLSQSSIDYKQIINEIIKLAIDHIIELKVNKEDMNKQEFLLNLVEKFDEANEKLKFDNSKRLYLELAILKSINFKKEISKISNDNLNVSNDNLNDAYHSKVITTTSSQTNFVQPQHKEEASQKITANSAENINKPVASKLTEEIVVATPPAFAIINDEEDEEKIENIIDPNQVNMDIFNNNQDVSSNEEVKIDKEVVELNEEVVEDLDLINDDEILNVLVQASRAELDLIKNKWPTLNDYLMNRNTKEVAGLLVDSIPVAASEKAIIVVVEQSVVAPLINDVTNIQLIANFFTNILDDVRYCFALDKNGWLQIREKYIELRNLKSLPQPRDILENYQFEKTKPPVLIQKEDEENLRFAKMIFKDKLEIRKEEEENGY